jgi:hypothetical protein
MLTKEQTSLPLAPRTQRTISLFATGRTEKSVVNTTDKMATANAVDPVRPEWFHRNPIGKPVGLNLDLTMPSHKCNKAVFEKPSDEKESQESLIILDNLETSRSPSISNRL